MCKIRREINIKGLKIESVVEIASTVVKNKENVEISVENILLISEVKEDLPFEINKENT